MNSEETGQVRKTCVWWVCTLVALIPVAVIVWLLFFR